MNVNDCVLIIATGSQFTTIKSIEENKVNFTNGGWTEYENLKLKPGTHTGIPFKYLVDISKVKDYTWGNMDFNVVFELMNTQKKTKPIDLSTIGTIKRNVGTGHYRYKVDYKNNQWILLKSDGDFDSEYSPETGGSRIYKNTFSNNEDIINHLLKELNGE